MFLLVFAPTYAAQVVPAAQTDPAALHLRRGVQLLEAGAVDESVVELSKAVELLPESPEARFHLGRALFALGRADEALPHLEVALRLSAEPGPIQFLVAQVNLELDRLAAAREALDAAERSRPDFPPIGLYRAELCYRMGRVDEALERLAAVAAEARRWAVPRARSGTIALDDGRVEESIEWFRAAIELVPRDAVLWMRQGSALAAASRPREAAEAYRRALEIDPGRDAARFALAMELRGLEEYEAAERQLATLLEGSPEHAVARYERAVLLSRGGHHERALAEIDRALIVLTGQIGPGGENEGRRPYYAQALALRAELLDKLGRVEEATAVSRELVAVEPWFPQGHFLHGNLLLRQGDDSGRRHLERFKVLSDAREHRELGDYYREQVSQPARAAVEYEAALAADPDDHRSLLGLAILRRRTGATEEAVALLERAREAGAGGEEWYGEWVLALASVGREREASAAWEAARELGLGLGTEVRRVIYSSLGGC